MLATKEDIISKLRRDIASCEGFRPGQHRWVGLGEIERSFPNGIFPTGTCPEYRRQRGFIAGLPACDFDSGTHDLADSLDQPGTPNDFIPKPFGIDIL